MSKDISSKLLRNLLLVPKWSPLRYDLGYM